MKSTLQQTRSAEDRREFQRRATCSRGALKRADSVKDSVADSMYNRRVGIILSCIYGAVALIILYCGVISHSVMINGVTPFFTDLAAFPAYARVGFDAADISARPRPSDGLWRELPRYADKNTMLRIRDFDFPGVLKRRFMSPFAGKTQEFTMLIAVETDADKLAFINAEPSRVPGISLAGIGENWEVFLNGQRLRSEMHTGSDGRIMSNRVWRDVFFPMDKSLFKEGLNIFAFRIVGDPTCASTGLFYRGPYYLENYDDIEKLHNDALLYALCGIYFFMSIYHLMLFLSPNKDRSNLYYCIFSLLMGIYLFVQSRYVYTFIPDTYITSRLEYAVLFLAAPVVGMFLESVTVRRRPSSVSIGYSVFCLLLILTIFAFSAQYADDAFILGTVCAIIYMVYLVYKVALRVFVKQVRSARRRNAKMGIYMSFPTECLRALFETPSGNILAASFCIIICAVFDVANILFLHYDYGLFRYGFFAFAATGAFSLSERSNRMLIRLDESNATLDEINTTLEEAVLARTRELEIQARIAEDASEAAQTASKAKSEFLAHMSHEIRTPMNAILGMLELILRKELPCDIREDTLLIRQAGSNLLSIINDILDFSKIESGRQEIINESYSPASLINDVVSIIRIRLFEKPLHFVTNINGKLPTLLVGDETRLRQILLNLLTNALKYTQEGYFALTVDGEIPDGDKLFLKFEVSDTGIGIKEEDIDKLFGDFTRLDVVKHRRTEGTGLGLAITRSLCAAMNGNISVVSKYGKGSVFTVKIPQKIDDHRPVASVESPWTKRVLIYDHLPFRADSVIYSLESLDVWCSSASGREEFLKAMDIGPYSHIFVSAPLFDEVVDIANGRQEAFPSLVILAKPDEVGFSVDVKLLDIPVHSMSIANLLNGATTYRAYHNENCDGVLYPLFSAPSARVLVADDIYTNLKVIKGLLSPYKIETDVCLSGQEAIALASANRYDLIFMDHMMPGMDGLETAAAIRNIDVNDDYYRDLPIVALTANAVAGQRELFLRGGMNDFLAKPIELQKLVTILKKWLPKEKQTEWTAIESESSDAEKTKELSIPGVSVTKGLRNLGGSVVMYTDILEDFCRDAEERMAPLAESAHADDLTLYMTYAHALKGAARSVGAEEFADIAATMEMHAKNGNRAEIEANTGVLLAALRTLVGDIRDSLSQGTAALSCNEASESFCASKLTELRAALSNMDIRIVNELLLECAVLPPNIKCGMNLSEIEQQILMFEYDAAIAAIDAML
jgi:signal transduction histidine kinase/CheY-like chemotaxis protein/HPt (histidine-containing phosphotransfer) domain-containing protein